MGDESIERDGQPVGLRLAQRDEGSPTALDEQHCIAGNADNQRAGNAGGTPRCSLWPRNGSPIGLCRIGSCKHLGSFGGFSIADGLAKPLDGTR